MMQMNNHPLANQAGDDRTKLLLIAIWKLNGGKVISITPADIAGFVDAFNGMPTMMMRGQPDSIDISITTVGNAALQAAVLNQGLA